MDGASRKPVVIVSMLLGLGLTAGGMAFAGTSTLWLAMLALVLPLVTVIVYQIVGTKPAGFVCVLCVLAVLTPGLVYWFSLPAVAIYLLDYLVIVWCFRLIGAKADRFRLDYPIAIFFLTLVILLLVTGSLAIGSIQSLWALILGPLVYLLMTNSSLSAKQSRNIMYCLGVLCFVQFVAVLIQKFVLGIRDLDRIGGTFGFAGTTFIGVIMACFWVFVVANVVTERRWRMSLLLIVPAVTLGFAEAKAGFLMACLGSLPIVVATAVRMRTTSRLAFALASVCLPIMAGYVIIRYYPGFFLGSETMGRYWLNFFSNPDTPLQYLQGQGPQGQAGRLSSLTLAWDTLRSRGSIATGLGLGVLNTSGILGSIRTLESGLVNSLSWYNSASRTLLETGLVGLGTFHLMVLNQFRYPARLLRSHRSTDLQLGLGSLGSIVIFVIGGFYTMLWNFRALSIPFWVMLGVVYLEHARSSETIREETADPVVLAREGQTATK